MNEIMNGGKWKNLQVTVLESEKQRSNSPENAMWKKVNYEWVAVSQ